MANIDKHLKNALKQMYTPDSVIEFYNTYPELITHEDYNSVEQIYKIWMVVKSAYGYGFREGFKACYGISEDCEYCP